MATLGQLFDSIDTSMRDLSAKDKLKLLKMLAASNGHRVLPGLGTNSVLTNPKGPTVFKPARSPPTKSKKTKEQKMAIAKGLAITKQIKEESSKTGSPLPDGHPLLLERGHWFLVGSGKAAPDSTPGYPKARATSILHPQRGVQETSVSAEETSAGTEGGLNANGVGAQN
jgi:hypothetical protein